MSSHIEKTTHTIAPSDDFEDQDVLENFRFAESTIRDCIEGLPHAALESAIFRLRQALDQVPKSHPLHSEASYNLSVALLTRFNSYGWVEDMEETLVMAVDQFNNIKEELRGGTNANSVDLDVDSDTELPSDIIQTATNFIAEYHKSLNTSEINTAIYLYRDILASSPDNLSLRLDIMFELPRALVMRFLNSWQISDLNNAINLLDEALDLQIPPDSKRFRYLLSLSQALHIKFNQTSDPYVLDESTKKYQDASKEDDEARTLCSSAADMIDTFEEYGETVNLDDPISLCRTSLYLCSYLHPLRSESLNGLAMRLLVRFQQKGDIADLEESIRFNREALVLRPSPHPHRSTSLNGLASALWTRFEQKGSIADLEESTIFFREALHLLPSPHPFRSTFLSNLASALLTRFREKGDHGDSEESISLFREAVVLAPSSRPDRSRWLSNLAVALLRRFSEKGDIADLEESITFHQEALALRPSPHPERDMLLNNLAAALANRFDEKGDITDLEKSIGFHREALVLRPSPHPYRSESLNGLASVLSKRFS